MILGVLAGELLRSGRSARAKVGDPGTRGRGLPGASGWRSTAGLPDRQADLDAVLGGLQRRLDAADAGRLFSA